MNSTRSVETCQICDDETGKAGACEDSIYSALNFSCPEFDLQANDEIGPLCEHCHITLLRVGFIDDEK